MPNLDVTGFNSGNPKKIRDSSSNQRVPDGNHLFIKTKYQLLKESYGSTPHCSAPEKYPVTLVQSAYVVLVALNE